MTTMKYDITYSCNSKRGCEITALPHDSGIRPILSGVYETNNDFQKILFMVTENLDTKLEKEGPLEKKSVFAPAFGSLCVL